MLALIIEDYLRSASDKWIKLIKRKGMNVRKALTDHIISIDTIRF